MKEDIEYMMIIDHIIQNNFKNLQFICEFEFTRKHFLSRDNSES